MTDQIQTKCSLDYEALVGLYRTAERAIESGEYSANTWMVWQLCQKIIELELSHDRVIEKFPDAEWLLPSKTLSKTREEHEVEALIALKRIGCQAEELIEEIANDNQE